MIAILDYGAGNLRSVANALRALNVPHEVVQGLTPLRRARKIILPGVGHFGQMMRALEALKIREALLAQLRAGVPFLGICLGLQALFQGSEEAPQVPGLGLIPGEVRRFQGDIRVPHMGWDEIEPRAGGAPSRLLRGLAAKPYVYFAHSYYAPIDPSTSASCGYGAATFTAVLEFANVFGIQFHAEKSGAIGQQVLLNFAGL